MSIKLQVDDALSPDADTFQNVKDENGNASALFVSTGRAAVFGVPGKGAHFQIGLNEATTGQASAKLSFGGFGIEHAGLVWIPDGNLSNGKLHLTFGGSSDPSPRSRQPARVTFQADGRVGIGTMNPAATLDVSGDIVASGDVKLSGADCAEEFEVEEASLLEPGMVLVIGSRDRLLRCSAAYDRRVAGVLSGAGDRRPGIILGKQAAQQDRLPIALSGTVYCRVDASYAPVEPGDLLTTSDTAGHAMRAADSARAFGAVLGKALRPLASGRGLVPIIVSLQ
jgi:hypothetical protein